MCSEVLTVRCSLVLFCLVSAGCVPVDARLVRSSNLPILGQTGAGQGERSPSATAKMAYLVDPKTWVSKLHFQNMMSQTLYPVLFIQLIIQMSLMCSGCVQVS